MAQGIGESSDFPECMTPDQQKQLGDSFREAVDKHVLNGLGLPDRKDKGSLLFYRVNEPVYTEADSNFNYEIEPIDTLRWTVAKWLA